LLKRLAHIDILALESHSKSSAKEYADGAERALAERRFSVNYSIIMIYLEFRGEGGSACSV
jgi:hypothetical protein